MLCGNKTTTTTTENSLENTSVSYFLLKCNKSNDSIITGNINRVSTIYLLCSKCFACYLTYLYNDPVLHIVKRKPRKISKCQSISDWKAHAHSFCQYLKTFNYLFIIWVIFMVSAYHVKYFIVVNMHNIEFTILNFLKSILNGVKYLHFVV